jgi:hypothetical protein
LLQNRKKNKCIGRESNPGLAETVMATANFTTKPPMLITLLDKVCSKTAIYILKTQEPYFESSKNSSRIQRNIA